MSRTVPTLTVAVALLAAAAAISASEPTVAAEADADPGQAWRAWPYSRPIEVGADAVAQRLIQVPLPEGVMAHSSPELTDLRIIDDSGKETGYSLHWNPNSDDHDGVRLFNTQLIDTGHVPGRYTQAVADTAAEDRVHDVVVLQLLDRRSEFFAWAEIASSSDYETWRVLRSRAPVYHFRETHEEQAMRVTYPPTRDRWLRLRLERVGEAASVATVRVGKRTVEAKAELVPSSLVLELRDDSPASQSRWESHWDRGAAPVAAVRFETTREEFHRPVTISASEDGETWRTVGRGQIYRFLPRDADVGVIRESVQVDFRQDSAKHWRVSVVDGNDAPIEDLGITLLRPVQKVVFRPEPGRSFRLLYGNSRAAQAEYELMQLIDWYQRDAAPLGAVGAEEKNPNFSSSEPFSERHPILMWAALGLAVLVLGALAIRSLR